MGCEWITACWCCLGALLLPQIESLQLGVVAQFGGATRQTHASPGSVHQAAAGRDGRSGRGRSQHLLLAAREAAGQRRASGADLFPGHPRRFTLIGPSAFAQTSSMASIHGQKKELRDLVRRPPCTERLTATDSAPPLRDSAMGCTRYGPSATLTPDHQLYCEACFMVSDHDCIRTNDACERPYSWGNGCHQSARFPVKKSKRASGATGSV